VTLSTSAAGGFKQDYCHRSRDPLDRARRTLFAVDEQVEVEATWGIYQRMIAAYRDPDRTRRRALMTSLIESVGQGVPAALTEIRRLGRTLTQRAAHVLTSTGPAPTTDQPKPCVSRLEHLRGIALGFRNLTNYIARSLLETGGFRPQLLRHL